jgi:hypothetical protein
MADAGTGSPERPETGIVRTAIRERATVVAVQVFSVGVLLTAPMASPVSRAL